MKSPIVRTSIGPTIFKQTRVRELTTQTHCCRDSGRSKASVSVKVMRKCRDNDKSALEKVKSSMTFENGQYQLSIPWKNDKPDLPNNYSMTLRRLENTEKRLNRSPEVVTAYGDTIRKYIEKGNVGKVPEDEKVPERQCYLPHFAVVTL